MKQVLLLVVTLTLLFTKAFAQVQSNSIPWDLACKIPKGETRTIKGEKGKIIAVTCWRMENYAGNIPVYTLKMTKKEMQTGEKLEFILVPATSELKLLVLKENDELLIEARSSILAYFSGYIYDVH